MPGPVVATGVRPRRIWKQQYPRSIGESLTYLGVLLEMAITALAPITQQVIRLCLSFGLSPLWLWFEQEFITATQSHSQLSPGQSSQL